MTEETSKFDVDLNSSLSWLKYRVEKIEAEMDAEKRSIARRYGLWGGLIALTISIFAGGVSVYDRVKSELEKHENRIVRATEIAREINSVNLKFIELSNEADPVVLERYAANASFDVINLMEQFGALSSKVVSDLNTGDLVLFSEQTIVYGKQKRAIELAELAIANASNEIIRAYAKKQLIRALFADSGFRDLSRARLIYLESLASIGTLDNVNKDQALSDLYTNQVMMEAYANQCVLAQTALDDMRNSLSHIAAEILSNKVKTTIELANGSSRCVIT